MKFGPAVQYELRARQGMIKKPAAVFPPDFAGKRWAVAEVYPARDF
jgi:hypothetical protein